MSWLQHQQQQLPQQSPAAAAHAMQRQHANVVGTSTLATKTAASLSSSSLLHTQKQQQQQHHHQHIEQQEQGLLSNPQTRQQHWQQQNYLNSNKTMMQPTPAASPYPAAAPNQWQQQQQQQHPQQHQNATNANVYQQQTATAAATNSWQHADMQAAPQQLQQFSATPQQHQTHQQHQVEQQPQSTAYAAYYAQQQQQPLHGQQQQQHHQQNYQADAFNNYQQPMAATLTAPAQQPQQPAANVESYFDNNSSNNNNKNDGWGDWDWNDNSNNMSNTTEQQQQQQPPTPQQQQQQHEQLHPPAPPPQQTQYNSHAIEDSFRTETNDNWQWGVEENGNQMEQESQQQLPPPPPTQSQQQQQQQPVSAAAVVTEATDFYYQPQVPASIAEMPTSQQQQQQQNNFVDFAIATSQPINDANLNAKPNTLPLAENANENYNNVAATNATGNNIPSPVYVSQAKPVAKPSRQYASPPVGATPTELHEAVTTFANTTAHVPLSPPQGFQNIADQENVAMTTESVTAAVVPPPSATAAVTAILPPSTAALAHPPPPPATVLVPPPLQPTPASSPALPPTAVANNAVVTGNPFKRAGAAQHHRSGLMSLGSANATPSLSLPAVAAMSFAVPPPPADFANPMQLEQMQPENSEILHENQEVISLTAVAPVGAPLGVVSTVPAPPPPNDERNQYLQTSHLSENPDEELNLEADSLPPPGLSRLVLGQPELEATQRMVTGTEVPSGMNLDEERHADGEDTSMEQQPLMANAVTSLNHAPTSDRNLYLVPGESNARNEQRVVTGVERIETTPTTSTTVPLINEQREIELDGENLEDQQIQMQQQQQQIQQQHQQHHQQHQQQQHHHQQQPLHQQQQMQQHLHHQQQQQQPLHHQPPNSNNRNDPPLEGAAANVTATTAITASLVPNSNIAADNAEQQHHPQQQHHHHKASSKDLSNVSTGNDESEAHDEQKRYPHKSAQRKRNESGGGGAPDKNQINKRKEKPRRPSNDRYATEEEEDVERYSSEDEYRSEHEHERRRNYREGSTRSERDKEREIKEKKRRELRRPGGDYAGEKQRDKQNYRLEGSDRRRYAPRYDGDSKYETEGSMRHEGVNRKERRSGGGGGRNERGERAERSDRSERDYDDYRRYRREGGGGGGNKRATDVADERKRRDAADAYAEEERRRRRGGGGAGGAKKDYREDYENSDRRQRRDKHQQRGGDYEEYRKQSSRNARNDSDLDKSRRGGGGPGVGGAAASAYDARNYGYPPNAYEYDPYSYYYQRMAQTNPEAYAIWYNKFYGQHAAAGHAAGVAGAGATHSISSAHAAGDHLNVGGSVSAAGGNDGRESVHSGRSSVANNDHHRFSHAYHSQANDYHQQQHHHHQHFMHQQQHLAAALMSHTLNSTMLEDTADGVSNAASLSRGRSTGNLSQLNTAADYYAGSTRLHADGNYYARSDYAADSRSVSLRDSEHIATDPQRLTPCKFINDHAVVSFSAGLLITVKPKYTPSGVSNIVKMLRLGANDATRQLFQDYQGPLVRGLTHKKTIIKFCEEQIRVGPSNTTIYAKQLLPSNVEQYKASYTLMWNLLILLLRQNGMVVGTDIAELLLKNQQQFPYSNQVSQTPNTTASNSIKTHSKCDSGESNDETDDNAVEVDYKTSDAIAEITDNNGKTTASEADADAVAATTTVGDAVIVEESSSLSGLTKTSNSSAVVSSEHEITAKFRNFLLYGNVNEALDWATDNNLWGHALFLASKVDRRSHANVMMKFANKLSLNDPLQTLYQLMSGRTPSSVTSVQDEKWGDWRPHLSMILSNTSQKPELDRKAITTLGDSLFNRGDLYAAHFCYLMAQVSFGRYNAEAAHETTLQQSLPKLVLLGSSHYKHFKEFASNEAIMMTEIYEYACSLNDDKFSLGEFQPYKYLLATRMLDYGNQLKSLMYLEQISLHIQRDPSKFEPSFINKVYELAERLKFYDPVLEKSLDDPQNMDGSLNGSLHNFEEQKWLQTLRTIVAENTLNYAPNYEAPPAEECLPEDNYQNQIDQQFAEINKQFSELNMQYHNNNSNNVEPTLYNTEQQQPTTAAPPPHPTATQQAEQPLLLPTNTVDSNDAYNQQQQQHLANNADYDAAHYAQQQQAAYPAYDNQEQLAPDAYANYAQQQQSQQYLQPQQQQQQSQQQYYDPTQAPHYNAEADAQNSGAYDYWGGQAQQSNTGEETRPTISMPNAKKSYDDGAQQQQQQQQGGNKDVADNSNSKKNRADGAKDAASKSAAAVSNQNSGWFGGIWNKLSMKPKNQMILPDDKNPAIVWDADKKRWVNTDGDEKSEDAPKAPPKMSDLMSQQQQHQQQQSVPPQMQPQHLMQQQVAPQQQQQLPYETQQYGVNPMQQQQPAAPVTLAPTMPTAALSPNVQGYSANVAPVATTGAETTTKPPSLQSNMFKMQRNRTLKNSYVDVFNPSGAPMSKAAENILAPALPSAAVPAGGFFIPGAVPAASGNDNGAYQQQGPGSLEIQQFYNPAEYSGASY